MVASSELQPNNIDAAVRALGRGVVINHSDMVPEIWTGCPEVTVDEQLLADSQRCRDVAVQMHKWWLARTPFVVKLNVEQETLKIARTCSREPWQLGAEFMFWEDQVAHFVWVNNYDARNGTCKWWWGNKAERALPVAMGGNADVVDGNGEQFWVDGGPFAPIADLPFKVIHRDAVEGQTFLTVPNQGDVEFDDGGLLAPDQRLAVTHEVGPARIIAPAGSGKTRVLAERLRHVLHDRLVVPSSITALAYNTRAANELQERAGAYGADIRTFHSLGWEILRHQSRVRLLNEIEVRRIIERFVKVSWRPNTDPLASYLEALSEVRTALRDPLTVEVERGDVPGFAEMFYQYREHLNLNGLADFDEQVYGSVERLLREPDVRKFFQRRCRHLLVDEFQDITPIYLLLIRLLSAPELNVFGVGDDDQVIYQYAGADPEYLVSYGEWFPGAKEHALEVNYRCPEQITVAASSLVSQNVNRVNKTITAGRSKENVTGALTAVPATVQDMATVTGDLVESAVKKHGSHEVAVLARVNASLLATHILLASRGVRITSTVSADILKRTGIRSALAFIEMASTPEKFSSDALLELLRRTPLGRKVGTKVRKEIISQKWWSVDELKGLGGPPKRYESAEFHKMATLVVEAGKQGGSIAVLHMARLCGLDEAASSLERKGDSRASHLDDLAALESASYLHPELEGFQSWLQKMLRGSPQKDGVVLSSVHRVKGREWEQIIVLDVSEKMFPHRQNSDVEEERRVMHVAVTRAKTQATLVYNPKCPSRFLRELGINVKLENRDIVDLERKVRQFRERQATLERVPAYRIFDEETLNGVIRSTPKTLSELRQVKGFSQTRCEKYGTELLALLES